MTTLTAASAASPLALLLDEQTVAGMADCWVYFLGERTGTDIKIGRSADRDVLKRVASVNQGQTTNESYVLLAAVVGSAKDESALKRHFAAHQRTDKGSRTEYFLPHGELVEYVGWLCTQYFTRISGGSEFLDGMPRIDSSAWTPAPGRTVKRPEVTNALIQPYDFYGRDLDGTPWAWLPNPDATVQDYFTPPDLVDAARVAMGDIDLDAASHYAANRVHKIPQYFDLTRSAFDNDWHGRVWLNPPYGNNGPWFERIKHFVELGTVEQLCMLSPMWAFTTAMARPVVRDLSRGLILLSPTPKFWGNRDGRTGTNNPHGIIYIGPYRERFLKAYRDFGIPCAIDADDEFIPNEVDG